MHGQLRRGPLHADLWAEINAELDCGLARLREGLSGQDDADPDIYPVKFIKGRCWFHDGALMQIRAP